MLTGFDAKPDLEPLQSANADILGITVASVAHLRSLSVFLEEHNIVPEIDRVFAFEDAAAAYAYLRSAQHFGKVVIRFAA